jgi:hypothetical protein
MDTKKLNPNSENKIIKKFQNTNFHKHGGKRCLSPVPLNTTVMESIVQNSAKITLG